jgi:hypothetical protein
MGGSKQTQTTTATPFEPALPAINSVLSLAQQQLSSTPQFFPGQTVAQTDPATLDALSRIEERAKAGNPFIDRATGFIDRSFAEQQTPAESLLGDTARGAFLDRVNPFLDQQVRTQQQRAADLINSQFAGAGRFASGANAGVLADRLGEIGVNAFANNFENERQRQMQAANTIQAAFDARGGRNTALAGLLPTLADASFANDRALLGVGGAREAIAQRLIDAERERFEFERDAPIQRLGAIAPLVLNAGSLGGTNTTTTQAKGSKLSGILGAASLAAGLLFPPAGAGLLGSSLLGAAGGGLGLASGLLGRAQGPFGSTGF